MFRLQARQLYPECFNHTGPAPLPVEDWEAQIDSVYAYVVSTRSASAFRFVLNLSRGGLLDPQGDREDHASGSESAITRFLVLPGLPLQFSKSAEVQASDRNASCSPARKGSQSTGEDTARGKRQRRVQRHLVDKRAMPGLFLHQTSCGQRG